MFLFFWKNITDEIIAPIITNANIIYPHNFIVDSTNPAPVNSISSFNVKNFSVTIFWVLNIVNIPARIAKIITFFNKLFINLLFLSIVLSIPSKYKLNTII